MEELPDQCPPAKALDVGIDEAFRVIPFENPTLDDFKSYAAQKKRAPPGVDLCRWASCSLCVTKEQATILAGKLPKLREKDPHVVKLSIKKGSGRSMKNYSGTHIDFWMFATFNPLTAIIGASEKVNGA